MPSMADIPKVLDEVMDAVGPLIGQGVIADYIPGLATVAPDRFGMAVVTNDGESFGVGDWERPFSTQSITKVFTLALAYAREGDRLWERVGREPSGDPFNSLAQLELNGGIPRNPFINSGALVVVDRMLSLGMGADGTLLDFLRAESGSALIDVNLEVAASEAEYGHRNAAIAHLLASFSNLDNPVERVLDEYFLQCSIEMSCRDLAAAGGFLARNGARANGEPMLGRSETKRINAIMLSCGTYDAAGEFAYRVGLPGKSGVGGGILAVVPGKCTICVWSPGLDESGNSLAGVAALDEFTTRTGWSIF
jgi:glutaminase